MTAVVVLKFGGTSVATVDGWRVIEQRARAVVAEGKRPVIVHSALAGVSNGLEALIDEAIDDGHYATLDALGQQHADLAQAMGIADSSELRDRLTPLLDQLRKLTAGIALIGEASPRQRARIMSLGERMASALGLTWLQNQQMDVTGIDARDLLLADFDAQLSDNANYLNAACRIPQNETFNMSLPGARAILTQGFVARNARGDTVVLGRGGSDTSASYIAALFNADRLEIWTDVAGMFSADPRRVPGAHLLRRLDYAEAQEIASTGARVLHPRCISPARESGIPLHVRSTMDPERDGTVISDQPGSDDARLKAVSVRKSVTLISMETAGMWQQPGFLARAFAVFASLDLSIDLVSSSQTSVTVSLDVTGPLHDDTAQRLIVALSPMCRVTVVPNCAAISLVGRRVRAILHQLAPALDVFREFEVHLVSQAANDLNFTFVVDDAHADKLVQRLHDLLIHRTDDDDPVMGERGARVGPPEPSGGRAADAWWLGRREALLELAPPDTPRYVYARDVLTRSAARLTGLSSIDRVFYATKANAHAGVLNTLSAAGIDMECVSINELAHACDVVEGLSAARCLFTPNFAPRDEYKRALDAGAAVTVDNLFVLEKWGEVFAGQNVLLRVDPGRGGGHHRFVRTAGKRSKFGVPLDEIGAIAKRAAELGTRIVGLHAHKGSGIVDADTWSHTARTLAQAASQLPDVRVLNLGGGLGIPDTVSDPSLDLDELDQSLAQVRHDFPDFDLWLEPGRFLVANAGVLLTRVTQIKRKDGITFVGVNAGMHSLIRPALYGAYHHMVNLSKIDEPASECVDVVGPICESADVLGKARFLPPCEEGDVILIANTGAYGRVMSSHYNHRSPGDEALI